MKSIIYILGIALLATVNVSCKKWLDVKPSSELDGSELFSTESGYAEALAGVYSNMGKPALYGRELTWGTLDVLAGTYRPSINGDYLPILNYQYKRANANYLASTATKIDGIWSNMYKQIANLNALLANIDDHKNVFTQDNYNVIKGEALGLRAFLHLELLKLYGPSYQANGAGVPAIPYVFELTNKVSPILTVDNVMGRIIEDLKQSRELLGKDPIHLGTAPSAVLAPLPSGNYTNFGISVWHNRRFSFNYYAATATLARAYLWKGDKLNALVFAKEIIKDQPTRFQWVRPASLSTIGSSNPAQDPTFATEHIFALNTKNINDAMDGYIYFGPSTLTLSTLVPFGLLSYGGIFEGSTDIRQLYLASTYNGDPYSNKYYQFAQVYQFFKERVPLIRVSEMFYIAAECETDLNQARLDLDAVRANRGLSSMALSTAITRTQLDDEIRKEYRKEFIGEGQLWYYQKRKDLDLADFNIGVPQYNVYYFTNKNQYIFDRPDKEDSMR